ncbi:hypothetical protein HJC10_35465 [Corallococcus exiguus]|uniref:type II toxin-antitoxin system VapC family toxin n=1 Tax=Corallococcus exiguus TaxID=83462 RepID=UPI001471B2D0|nr:hypothetical protein [Corallococcus exiguus]NNB98972.1 hypothetical protein [Corallococcus exiguus]NNC08125.1 hypothetical protein [Corallococcus exiguus]
MPTPLADIPSPPPNLLLTEPVPSDALFFDTNCALNGTALAKAQGRHQKTLISSLVYAELTVRRKTTNSLKVIDTFLADLGIQIVPFDTSSARCFFDLSRQVRFDAPPLIRQQESPQACRNRLRFDLAIFAAALQHRATLITDNTNDFEHFPYRAYWKTRSEADLE